MKRAFTTAPLLRHFDVEKPVRLETDASNFAIGAIIAQQYEEGQWHPVAYYSRKLKDAKTR